MTAHNRSLSQEMECHFVVILKIFITFFSYIFVSTLVGFNTQKQEIWISEQL